MEEGYPEILSEIPIATAGSETYEVYEEMEALHELPEYCNTIDYLIEREGVKPYKMADINASAYVLFGELDFKEKPKKLKIPRKPSVRLTKIESGYSTSYVVMLTRHRFHGREIAMYTYTPGAEKPEEVMRFVKYRDPKDEKENFGKRMSKPKPYHGFKDRDREVIEYIVNQARFGKKRLRAADG